MCFEEFGFRETEYVGKEHLIILSLGVIEKEYGMSLVYPRLTLKHSIK